MSSPMGRPCLATTGKPWWAVPGAPLASQARAAASGPGVEGPHRAGGMVLHQDLVQVVRGVLRGHPDTAPGQLLGHDAVRMKEAEIM